MILTSNVYVNYWNISFLFVTDDETDWLFTPRRTPRRSKRKYTTCAPRTYEQNPQKFIAHIDQVQHVAWDNTIIRD